MMFGLERKAHRFNALPPYLNTKIDLLHTFALAFSSQYGENYVGNRNFD